MNYEELEIGDIIELKKPHPSKTIRWELIRIGAKYKFRSCDQFDLFIELNRQTLKMQLKKIIKKTIK
ncbi:DUF951 domain-containing protein [Mycoplasma mycoides subsp. mycoides]|uniref:DUF951 domain-containing protein n=2 Tax=Mycoplasma mycoides subsp. mycoides TaxID=2103 RepID=Q6MS66_MYCMS|nr:DUF951 domain-containing protein [Mycoplasma mycoides]CAE77524.1 Conserved hypothetical protein [Mycoplasma mycoides subsp. mycoides SC str. PG1]ADK69225.1 conserved hypothetical protein [Mycoplasma mycoides subsp. mycoides SC str. Gladysdale]AIZ55777.1 hypothetical protein mycmycITA_00964 [Mycoplasma mycoides subsp. mycoides]AME11091.1 hypothetical protein MmmBen_0958 [Mycoplasma mycoides subsp. mycoides]AME12105.1 hypothetical protein MmmBen50_0944 [Mycoplasma mycoides subsp. mycoides]